MIPESTCECVSQSNTNQTSLCPVFGESSPAACALPEVKEQPRAKFYYPEIKNRNRLLNLFAASGWLISICKFR